MTWPEMLERASVEVLVDDRRADVGGPRDGRGVAELLADGAHDCGQRSLGLRLGFGRAMLRERNRREQCPAPRAEVLGAELAVHERPDVFVQPPRREVDELSVVIAVPKEPAAAGELPELS